VSPPSKTPVPDEADVRDRLEKLVRRTFPAAEAHEAHRMKGWRIPRKTGATADPAASTMDPRYVVILPAFRSAGLTIHLMNPADYRFLDGPRERLEQTGFGVMQACITWKRKSAPPWEALDDLLQELRRSAST
jgi:hypothetical protein